MGYQHGNVVVLDDAVACYRLCRELDDHDKVLQELTIRELEDELYAVVNGSGKRPVVAHFGVINHLSSAAMSALLSVEKHARESHKDFALSGISPELYETFRLTRLNKHFNMYRSPDDAVKCLVDGKFINGNHDPRN